MTQERTLGPTETRLLNQLAADGRIIFSTDQARTALGNGKQDINKLLYHLGGLPHTYAYGGSLSTGSTLKNVPVSGISHRARRCSNPM